MTQSRIHPLVAAAAGSVLLVSLLGAAAITGLLPNSHSSVAPSTTAQATNTLNDANALNPNLAPNNAIAANPALPAQPGKHPSSNTTHSKHNTTSHTAANTNHGNTNANSTNVAQATCNNCGTVLAVNTVQHAAAHTSGVGAVLGGVLGGVLGNQVGGGNGKKVATVAGAVGGGLVGNEIEKRNNTTNTYEIKVKMEDGSVRSFSQSAEPVWHSGDRVRVENGQLSSRA